MERYMRNQPGCQCCPSRRPSRNPDCPQEPPKHPAPCPSHKSMYDHIDQMMPAMAYVPYQQWQEPMDLCRSLCLGTIFSDLCKPFCGRREMCR